MTAAFSIAYGLLALVIVVGATIAVVIAVTVFIIVVNFLDDISRTHWWTYHGSTVWWSLILVGLTGLIFWVGGSTPW